MSHIVNNLRIDTAVEFYSKYFNVTIIKSGVIILFAARICGSELALMV